MSAEFLNLSAALDVAEKFLSTSERLPELTQPWSQMALNEGEQIVNDLYGQRLGQLFEFQDAGAGAGEVSRLSMSSDDPRVLAFEFGVRPHEIWAHHTALRFDDRQGELLYRRMVHHPGVAAHNFIPQVEEQWAAACERDWTDGLEAIVLTLGAE